VAEYLTFTGPDNITRPYLLEEWEGSEDLKTWTLYCKKGILFNNGDEFNADDVIFNLKQWLDEDVGSSILGLMSYLQPENIEKVDEYTVKLHLSAAQIAVPEHLYHYPAQIMNHRTFEGDFVKTPVGTGPFTLEEFTPGERVVLKARKDPPYWRNGDDGEPLPYLDEIVYIDMGDESSAHVTAFQGEQVDVISIPRVEHYLALRDDPTAQIVPVKTAQTRVLRMRVDKEPWTDNRVRMALKLCQDRTKILEGAYYGEGVEGSDCHVSPIHPAYAEVPIPAYDPEKAKALLAEAGYENGLTVELNVGEGWGDTVTYAQILQQDAAPAGFDIEIQTMPVSAYWDIWTECDLGITAWTHRSLGTMVLGLAYVCDEEGKPVPWNETRWCDEEFTKQLDKARATLDVEERRKVMLQLEQIQMERGSIGIAYWRDSWGIAKKKVRNFQAHPTLYDLYKEIWLEEA
jgi:peptide/nickel transport system substrate-binding protein